MKKKKKMSRGSASLPLFFIVWWCVWAVNTSWKLQSFPMLLRSVVLRNLKMRHLRSKGVMFFKLHTHSTHFDVCSFFYDLGLYLWKRSEPPQGGQPHSLKNVTFYIFLSYILLDFRTGNLLTDVLNQNCLPDYHRGHSYYKLGVFLYL